MRWQAPSSPAPPVRSCEHAKSFFLLGDGLVLMVLTLPFYNCPLCLFTLGLGLKSNKLVELALFNIASRLPAPLMTILPPFHLVQLSNFTFTLGAGWRLRSIWADKASVACAQRTVHFQFSTLQLALHLAEANNWAIDLAILPTTASEVTQLFLPSPLLLLTVYSIIESTRDYQLLLHCLLEFICSLSPCALSEHFALSIKWVHSAVNRHRPLISCQNLCRLLLRSQSA